MTAIDTLKVRSTYEAVKEKLSQPVPAGFVRLMAGREILGYVKKDVAIKLAGATSDFRLTDVLSMNEETLTSVAKRSAALKKAADILDALGVLPKAVSSELVDVRVSVYDATFCQAPRNLTRVLGLLTTSVRLNAYDVTGKVVFAKRQASKFIGGGKWDSLAAGIVKASEAPLQALYRELFEEAGLTANEVCFSEGARFVQELPVQEGMLREVVLSFDGQLQEGAVCCNRDGAVSAFESFDLPEALQLAKHDELMYAAAISLCESAMRTAGERIEEKWLFYKGQLNF